MNTLTKLTFSEVDGAFKFMKDCLLNEQANLDRQLQNNIHTGIMTIDQAFAVWDRECHEFSSPKIGRDGYRFMSRKILKISPHNLGLNILLFSKLNLV